MASLEDAGLATQTLNNVTKNSTGELDRDLSSSQVANVLGANNMSYVSGSAFTDPANGLTSSPRRHDASISLDGAR